MDGIVEHVTGCLRRPCNPEIGGVNFGNAIGLYPQELGYRNAR
jgi:hypothetical protein